MAFKMNFNREDLSGKPPVPPGWYNLQVKNFKPKIAGEQKDSLSFNGEFSIVGNGEYEGRKVFNTLNTKGGWIINDFVHGCGLRMEVEQDANTGTEAETLTFPGAWEGSDKFPDDPTHWKYVGPLTNKVFEAELAITEYQGRQKNEIRQFRCAVPGCTEKHSTNLISGKA